MLDRMSPLDAAFLDAEDEDKHASMAIAAVAVMEGPAPDQEEFVEAIAGRLPLVPRYRQRLRTVPLDLGRPVWVDDPSFDIRYHVRRTALPAPGDDETLCRLVARVMSQRLDRDRPLWECWVVEGLTEGRWAMITKVHHCMVDGISGTNLYAAFFDASPEALTQVEDHWAPTTEPSTLRLTAEAVRDLAASPVDQLRLLSRALRSPGLAVRITDTARGLATLAEALVPSTPSSLSGPIGRSRRYGIGRASLADVASVRKKFHVTTNDVVLAAISGGFRRLLLDRGERPDGHVIRSLIPVSVRKPGEEGIYENRISLMLAFLPVECADPIDRLKIVHARLSTLKASKEALAGATMTTLAKHEPFPPISWGIRLVARIPQRSIVTVTTNVPGPRRPLYLLGRRMLEMLPYVPIAVRLRIGVSVLTYCDQIAIGVTSDYGSAPEAGALARAIEDGIAELVEC
jgi:diacylglycerol O-acyltransferase